MVTRRKLSREFKLEAVKLVTERGVTVAQASKDLDVHDDLPPVDVPIKSERPGSSFDGNGDQICVEINTGQHATQQRLYFGKLLSTDVAGTRLSLHRPNVGTR